jgi:RNA 2',3'-cyclic 3'-phosphodiesterase
VTVSPQLLDPGRAFRAARPRSVAAVAKERLKSPRARLFVALDLPDAVRDGLAEWQARALSDPALRPMRREALHVTLCFLSYHPEKLIPRIAEAVASIAARSVELRFESEPSPRPKGRPRLYALDAHSEGAVALQAELSEALEAERFYKPEKRAFWPHVTVARVRTERQPPGRGERRGTGRPKRVAEPPGALPDSLTEPFGAVRMALYRSSLKPQGAEYVSLAGVDLPSPRDQKR